VSQTGSYEAAGSVFEYNRIDSDSNQQDKRSDGITEWITSTGPLYEPVHLMVRFFVFVDFLEKFYSSFLIFSGSLTTVQPWNKV
jgi:hypothetical protein